MQIVVWPGTILGEDKTDEFEKWFNEQGFNVTYLEEFKTLPDSDEYGNPVDGTGGRNELLFVVADGDIGKFAVWRLKYNMHWWEDYLDSGAWEIVPPEVLNRYPYTWYNCPDKYSRVFTNDNEGSAG